MGTTTVVNFNELHQVNISMEIINVITNSKNVFSEQETIYTFRSADLPKVCIPADFESSMESSGSDN